MGSHDSGAAGTGDAKRSVEAGYDRVALDYARREGEAEWPG